ncbi:MAG: RDD family protein [Mariprofundaceae bacterium]|nr:RDD family protein [Mariprofundaceae bacterium]
MANTTTQAVRPKAKPAGIVFRFLASGYDLTILFGLLFIAFGLLTLVDPSMQSIPKWLQYLLSCSIAFAYFVGFWHKAGTTTGMRPWKLQVAMVDTGDHPSFAAASIRFAALCLTWIALGETFFLMNLYIATGQIDRTIFAVASVMPALSLLIMILTPQRQALHDVLSGTSVFRVAKI